MEMATSFFSLNVFSVSLEMEESYSVLVAFATTILEYFRNTRPSYVVEDFPS